MGDMWDYKLRKLEIAWELAQRIIPTAASGTGKWSEATFFKHAQEALKEAQDIVDTVFIEDE